MKTLNQLTLIDLRTTMRSHAMVFRQEIHPDRPDETCRPFGERMNRAVAYLRHAIDYRNMAQRREARTQ